MYAFGFVSGIMVSVVVMFMLFSIDRYIPEDGSDIGLQR